MKLNYKKIAIFSLIFTVLIIFLLLKGVAILWIGFFCFAFSIAVGVYVLISFSNEHLQADVEFLNEAPKNANSLKKISTKNHFYNNGVFYIINKEQKAVIIPFSDIIKVDQTFIKINNRRVWKVVATYNGKTIDFRFRHSFTLWNKNFPKFLKELKRLNPNAKVGKFNFW